MTLRVANGNPNAPFSISDAVEAIMRRCMASDPKAVLVAWEDADGDLTVHVVPGSAAMLLGMIMRLHKDLVA